VLLTELDAALDIAEGVLERIMTWQRPAITRRMNQPCFSMCHEVAPAK
jgi:hypothetical protein